METAKTCSRSDLRCDACVLYQPGPTDLGAFGPLERVGRGYDGVGVWVEGPRHGAQQVAVDHGVYHHQYVKGLFKVLSNLYI